MILRFNVKEAVYTADPPSFCGNTIQATYAGISGSIKINGVNAINFTNLASGLFIHAGLPFVAGGVTINNIILENSLYVALEIDTPNLLDTAEIEVTLDKTGYTSLVRRFTVFGYDIGRNPNIALTSINPDLYLVLIPSPVVGAYATTGLLTPAIGIAFTITANNIGTLGNAITFSEDGINTIENLVAIWNAANPLNTCTVVYTSGSNYISNILTFNLTGGVNVVEDNVAYADFVGWRKPFKNDLYLFANYSNIADLVEYTDTTPATLGTTHTLVLPCYSGAAITLTSRQYEGCPCGCGSSELISSCSFGPLTFPKLILIPSFSAEATCDDSCSDDCLVTINDNYVQFVIDVDAITPLNLDDVEIVSTESVDLEVTMYSACGVELNNSSAVASLNPVPALVDLQVPITIPEQGDFVLKCKISTAYYECYKVLEIQGCHRFTVTKTECNTHVFKNLSLDIMVISIEKLIGLDEWQELVPITDVDSCAEYTIQVKVDGVYRIIVDGTEYRIFIEDCNMKTCFVNYMQKRICNSKASCACGGNCNGLCNKIPIDLYDYNVFMSLVYGYMSILNGLYLKNFIYTVFTPNDNTTLYDLNTYLERIQEYCGTCVGQIIVNQVSKSSGCGCNK